MVLTSVFHVNTWITTHLLTPEGWKAELAWLADQYCNSTAISDLKSTLRVLTRLCMGKKRRPEGICALLVVYLQMRWFSYSILSVAALNVLTVLNFFIATNCLMR